MKISICIPVYNGAESIGPLVNEIGKHFSRRNYEIIFVNDCSLDDSEAVCESIAKKNKRVKFISLRRNFGEHNAVMCALNHCTGDYAAIIDDDFQNPPSEILRLIQTAQTNKFDVVYSIYKKKKHSWFRNLGSKFNNIVATWLLSKPSNLYLSSFKVICRDVIDEIIKYQGPFPYIDGLILRVTSNIGSVFVDHHDRQHGRSNYTLYKLISLWLNMFINFSIRPLRVFTLFGGFISMISFVFILFLTVLKIIAPMSYIKEVPMGWTSLICSILLFSGIQLIFLGLVGEYIGKHYLDYNKTPQWVIRKKIIK